MDAVRSVLSIDGLEAVFFDFDDALVQSLDIKAGAFMSLFADRDVRLQGQILEYFLHHTGRSRQRKIRHVYSEMLKEPLDEGTLDELCCLFAERSLEAVIAAPEVAGAAALLEALAVRRMPVFVVSGTPEVELQQVVEARGMGHFFSDVRGTPVEKEINIAELIARHGLEPSRCLMVGDGRVDLIAAQHNRMPFVGVVKAENPFAADVPVVRDLAQLHKWLLDHENSPF